MEAVPAGVPGMGSNVATGGASLAAGSGPTLNKEDRTVNYEIGKVTSHIVEPLGKLTRVSVAVVVDGIYKRVEGGEGEKEWQYLPRTEEEMKKYENIVKGAIDYDTARGDTVQVVNIPFENEKFGDGGERISGGEKTPFLVRYQHYFRPVMQYGFIAVVVFLLFTYVVRPVVHWLTAGSIAEAELFGQLPKTVNELEREYEGEVQSLPYRDQALALLTQGGQNPGEVMKSWLSEE
jgi:flagellar M-ring protein FliF